MASKFTILSINKGDSLLPNRVPHINNLIQMYKPHIFCINELNLTRNDNISPHSFPGYKLEVDTLRRTDSAARTGILIREGVKYKRRTYLDTSGTATVWIQVSQAGKKPFLVLSIYRQFQRLGISNALPMEAQYNRWQQILDTCELASGENKEIIALGDLNLNQLAWGLHPNQMTPNERSKDKMVTQLRTRLLEKGHKVLNSAPTRNVGSLTEKPTCLDYIITNSLDKVINFETVYPTFSDHALLVLRKRSKVNPKPRHYIRTRSYKKFSREIYKRSIQDHRLYLETHYTGDIDRVTSNIQTIIQEALDEQAPMEIRLISKKNAPKISDEAKELLIRRDSAHKRFMETKDPQDMREMKNLRNYANRVIGKENFCNKVKKFNSEELTMRQKWRFMKEETGQAGFKSPQVIVEGNNHYSSPLEMANSLNRQFIIRIRKLIDNMTPQQDDPLIQYRNYVGRDNLNFQFENINMSQLRNVLTSLKASGSAAENDISMSAIKSARTELEPLFLYLTNLIISRAEYPTALKTTKVVAIKKETKEKYDTSADYWHPINVVCAISKIVERTLLGQMLKHIEDNNLISHAHHGSIRAKSTQTLITDLHDSLIEDLKNDKDTALLVLDQSKAYDLVNHKILLDKFRILGF